MISVAPEVPPVRAHHQCQCPSVPVPISATSMPHISAYQCTSMPHISAHLSCLSMSPISASQCHLSMPISVSANSVTYQCAAYHSQCQSVPVAYQCQVSVPNSALSVPVSAAYQ
ncbi:unnamed protein product, partial [Staurois parvus]